MVFLLRLAKKVALPPLGFEIPSPLLWMSHYTIALVITGPVARSWKQIEEALQYTITYIMKFTCVNAHNSCGQIACSKASNQRSVDLLI